MFDLIHMSRAIQRLMKDYRKAEKLVGRSSNEPFADFANTAAFTTQTYAQQMAQLRRDPELSQDEKKYLVAVERKNSILLFLNKLLQSFSIHKYIYSAGKNRLNFFLTPSLFFLRDFVFSKKKESIHY